MLSNAPIGPVLPAADISRARKFYSEKLGLKESANQMPGDDSGVLFDCGKGSKLYIYLRPLQHPVEHTQAYFAVEDLDAEMSDLRSRGVEFEEYDMPGLKTENGVVVIDGHKSAWFKDSEGNAIAIGQMG